MSLDVLINERQNDFTSNMCKYEYQGRDKTLSVMKKRVFLYRM